VGLSGSSLTASNTLRFRPRAARAATASVSSPSGAGREEGVRVLLDAAAGSRSPFTPHRGRGTPARSPRGHDRGRRPRRPRHACGTRDACRLPREYAAAHTVVVPSIEDHRGDRDGLPNVVLEALASGRAVVASDVGAVRSAVRDGRTGPPRPTRRPAARSRRPSGLARQPDLRTATRPGRGARSDGRPSAADDARAIKPIGASRPGAPSASGSPGLLRAPSGRVRPEIRLAGEGPERASASARGVARVGRGGRSVRPAPRCGRRDVGSPHARPLARSLEDDIRNPSRRHGWSSNRWHDDGWAAHTSRRGAGHAVAGPASVTRSARPAAAIVAARLRRGPSPTMRR